MALSPDSILLRNGTVLFHEEHTVRALREHDLLIEGDTIAGIGQNLVLPPDCMEIDCTGKIISPGFINGHHHLWQSQLKGRHGDQGFMEYMASGNLQSFNYQPDDIFWGQLGGCLQSIESGVTTVVDHAHMTYSPQHAKEGIRASVSSGIRTVFCYTAMRRIHQWFSTVEFENEFLPEWWFQTLESLATSGPFGDGRVKLGLAADPGIPSDVLVNLWQRSKDLGLELITMHYVAAFMANPVQLLSENNRLLSKVLVSHGNGISSADAQALTNQSISICSTPETEMQMGLGNPVAFREDLKSHTCIGVDCHANNSADILTQMRLVLQHTRAVRNEEAFQKGQYPSIDVRIEQAFNLGTIQGARAIGMEDQVGSLAVGKKADVLVFDALSPAMVCAGVEDPLAAIVLHASVRDIETVIVDGRVLKERGALKPVEVPENLYADATTPLNWREVSGMLLHSRKKIIERAGGQDLAAGIAALQTPF